MSVVATERPGPASAAHAALARVFEEDHILDPAAIGMAGLRYRGICPPPEALGD